MKTYKQLSKAQQRVIDFLKERKNSYALKSTTWNYQRMINPDLIDSNGYSEYEYFNKSTMKSLVRENVLVRSHYSDDFMKDRYILNPEFVSYKKFYFENEDENMCYPLSYHIENAKSNGLKEIELFEAIPDTLNKDMVWCTELEAVSEKTECSKLCPYYKASKGRICDLR